MDKKKLTNTDVAEQIGTSRQMLEAVAHGVRNFRVSDALRAAEVLGPDDPLGHLLWCLDSKKNSRKRTRLLERYKS